MYLKIENPFFSHLRWFCLIQWAYSNPNFSLHCRAKMWRRIWAFVSVATMCQSSCPEPAWFVEGVLDKKVVKNTKHDISECKVYAVILL